MLKLIKRYISVLVILLLSAIAIYPYLQDGFIIGVGENAVSISPIYFQMFYTWNNKIGFGAISGSQANILLYHFFWKFLGLFSQYAHPSVILTFLAFFLPGFFSFFVFKSIFKYKQTIVYLPASLLLSFNIFRLSVSYTNVNHNLLFILLPLFFYFYYKFLSSQSWLHGFLLIVVSLVSSSIGGNIAVWTVPYLLLFIMFCHHLMYLNHSRDLTKKSLLQFLVKNILLAVILLLVNMFWIVPLTISLLDYYGVRGSIWNTTTAGTFFDNFRFMGFWAFRSGYGDELYFPYSNIYYKLPLYLCTFFIPLFSFVIIGAKKGFLGKRETYLRNLSALIILIGFSLTVGAKGPFRFVYKYLYEDVNVFKMYREPYTKFMPLYIFGVALLLVLSTNYIQATLKSKTKAALLVPFLSIIILITSYPLFTKDAIFIKRWIEGSAGTVVKIPEYWLEAIDYFRSFTRDERITILPHSPYVSKYNWEYGVNVAGNIADYLVDMQFIKSWGWDLQPSRKVIIDISSPGTSYKNISKYLGFLGSRYILHENDMEWRYQNSVASPSYVSNFLKGEGLTPEITFGVFTPELLAKIPNEETNKNRYEAFYKELFNIPALVLYKLDEEYYVPTIYVPTEHIYVLGDVENLSSVMDLANSDTRTEYYFPDHGLPDSYAPEEDLQSISDQLIVWGEEDYKGTTWNVDNYIWEREWDWPEANVEPGTTQYFLARIYEQTQHFSKEDDLDKVDYLNWLGAKRAEELRTSNLSPWIEKKLSADLVDNFRKSILLVESLRSSPRSGSEDYLERVKRTYLYLERSLFRIERSGHQVSGEAYRLLDEYAHWINNREDSRYIRNDRVFSFDIPSPGEYTLKTKHLGDWTESKTVEIDSPQSLTMQLSEELPASQDLLSGVEYGNNDPPIFVQIPNWEPNYTYRVEFDYLIRNSEMRIDVLEDTTDYIGSNFQSHYTAGISTERVSLLEQDLYQSRMCFSDDSGELARTENCYSRYSKKISSSVDSSSGYIRISPAPESSVRSYVLIKNLQITKESPQAVLHAVKKSESVAIPTISFSRINPTKYLVKVTGATEPYTLSFGVNFHKYWKLYLSSNNNSIDVGEDPISYFGGHIKEGNHKQEFWNNSTTETWNTKPIAEDRHFVSNGYANAWRIYPQDVGGAEDYDLVLEFQPQQLFYKSIVVTVIASFTSLLGILYQLAALVYRRRKHD